MGSGPFSRFGRKRSPTLFFMRPYLTCRQSDLAKAATSPREKRDSRLVPCVPNRLRAKVIWQRPQRVHGKSGILVLFLVYPIVSTPKTTSIRLFVFAGKLQTDRLTDRQTDTLHHRIIGRNSRISRIRNRNGLKLNGCKYRHRIETIELFLIILPNVVSGKIRAKTRLYKKNFKDFFRSLKRFLRFVKFFYVLRNEMAPVTSENRPIYLSKIMYYTIDDSSDNTITLQSKAKQTKFRRSRRP